MNFLVITKRFAHQGMLGPISEKITLTEHDEESTEALVKKLDVPLNGECFVIESDSVIRVKSKIINEMTNARKR